MRRTAVVVVVVAWGCLLWGADAPSGAAWTQTLSGRWEFSPPGSEVFYPTEVPGTWTEGVPGADYKIGCDEWLTGTYRRTFEAPAGVTGAALEFDSIRWGGEVFVNGKSVGKHDLAYAEIAFDISKAVKPGKNLLEVKPVGWKAVERFPEGDPVIPCGAAHWFGNKLGGITGEVYLRHYNGARVSAVRVHPTSKGPACNLVVEVSAGGGDWKGSASAQVLTDDGKRAVSKVVRKDLEVKADGTVTLTLEDVRAPGAALWWPESPVMHRVVVWLETSGDPVRVANVREETFGFRDVAVRGGNFHLNGKRLALFGYSGVWIYGNYNFMRDDRRLRNHQVVLFRAMNASAFRCHQDPMARKWIDLCDRNGILIACEFPNFPDMQRLPKWSLESPYDRPRFVKNLQRDLRGQIFDRYNHPSIVIWSATNEGNGFSDWERRNLLPFVKSVDPTRPVMFSSDITDTIADHHNFAGLWYGSHTDFRRTAVDLARGYPDRLVGCTEFGQFGKSYRFYGRGMKEVPATEHVRNQAQLLMEQIETFRQLRYDIIMPYCIPYGGKATESGKAEDAPEHFDAMKNAFAPLGVSVGLARRHAPTGAAVDVPVWLLSDADDATGPVTVDVMILVEHPGFKWDGSIAGRKVVALQRFAEVVAPWQAKERALRFTTPAVEGVYTIAAVLRRPGKAPVVSLRPLRCYTSPPPAKKRLTVGVVERDGRIARWLAARGHRVVLVRGEHLPDVIVVGEGAVTDARLRGGGGFMVSERVKRGGARLVLLEQQAWSPRAFTGRICKDLVGVPLRVPLQEIFPEVDAVRKAVGGDRDFRRLNGVDNHALRVRLEPPAEEKAAAGAVGTGQPNAKDTDDKRPEAKSPWRPLMAAFTRGPKKPDWALVHRRFGTGEVFACQVPLIDRVDRSNVTDYDPVAERLLVWLIEGDPLKEE